MTPDTPEGLDLPLLPTPRQLVREAGSAPLDAPVQERIDPEAVPQPQGYHLRIGTERIELIAHDSAGAFYGQTTLAQIRRLCRSTGALPALRIDDWPDFARRGVMLDISRDKVPTMATLRRLVDELAGWKINELQLYTEHTFAYTNHRTVWEHASPLTPEQVRDLDAYCRARHVTLTANQNTLGHMERWLKHERYRPLAECDDERHTFAACLCPTDPRSIALIEELLSELAPCFSADAIHVGLDETFQIGRGRSRAICAERGTGRVYADYLRQVHAIAARLGKRIQFWADMVLRYEEAPAMIPADATAMIWGYEAVHPFDRETARIASVGLPFYVCPGTSAWNSITGRTDNMLANVDAAVVAGMTHGANGLLQTDWGDSGHLQPLPTSYPGYAYAAARSWCASSNTADHLPAQLNAHVLRDPTGAAGPWLLEAGRVATLLNHPRSNGSVLFDMLLAPSGTMKVRPDAGALADCRAALTDLRNRVEDLRFERDDAAALTEELRWACDLLIAACRRSTDPITPAAARQLRDRHRALWLTRNRPGG